MDLNLDTLKQEILEYLASEEFSVFRAEPGGLEDVPIVYWDIHAYPEFHGFLNAAKSTGVRLILFAVREFTSADIDNALDMLESGSLSRDDARSLETGLKELKVFTGLTASIELSFHYNGMAYMYRALSEWYESYLETTEAIEAADFYHMGDEDDGEDPGPLGGYYSKN